MNSSSAVDNSTVEFAYWKSGDFLHFRLCEECRYALSMAWLDDVFRLSVTARRASLNIVLRRRCMSSGALMSLVGVGVDVVAGTLGTLFVGEVPDDAVGTLGTVAGIGSCAAGVFDVVLGTLGTSEGSWSKISFSCSRILRLSELGGGSRSLVIAALRVTFKSCRTALSRSFFDEIGILKSPCGNHRTVSAMRTFPVDWTRTR